MCQKLWSDDVQFLRYGPWQTDGWTDRKSDIQRWVPHLIMAKSYHPVSLLSVVSKVFEKLVNNRFVDHMEENDLFLISSMLSGLLDRLQIYWQLYMIELPRLSIGLKLLECWSPSQTYGISGQIFRHILFFSVIGFFEWFWIGSLHKNILLMLEFLKTPFSALHFSCYALMTFVRLSVILLFMLMILLSTVDYVTESNLWDTLDWVRKWLVDVNAGKTCFVWPF